MAKTTRQTAIFGVEDWRKLYETYREADFQSYDFETLRKSFIDYIRLQYPESFNDFVESSEFVALLDVISFMGQSLAFRSDLNARENFLDTAERRDSVVRLAQLVGYTSKRSIASQGFLKILSISTTESVRDFAGNILADATINWNDATNNNWQEQFNAIINAALVDSQRIGKPGNSQTIIGIQTLEYAINQVDGVLPVIPFNASVNGISMPFEVVSATSLGQSFVYEPSPQPGQKFNILFRNDRLGFGSPGTGFFVYFKQGNLRNQDFVFNNQISNRTADITINGINDQDVWLYQLDRRGQVDREWKQVDNIFSPEVQTEQDKKNFFSVTSRANDQISINFGDGVFAEIPVGVFRAYARSSNGLEYVINPDDMQSVVVSVDYVSRRGRNETLTLTASLQTPVSNARPRETIGEIKQRAPAKFYTQNRMVNGEDYNNFPFAKFGSIIKSKAVNRSSIGVSRYLDLVDVTGKYSSTNAFASDGAIYQELAKPSFIFTWTDTNEIADTIVNQVEPLIDSRAMIQFYHAKFDRPVIGPLELTWKLETSTLNEATGYFYIGIENQFQSLGRFTSGPRQFVEPGALLKFRAPAGFYFDQNNKLVSGIPSRPGDKEAIWATPKRVIEDGTNFGVGLLDDGTGPVILNESVPTGAIVADIIPKFVTDLPVEFEQQMVQQVADFQNFGIGYDTDSRSWYLITSDNLAIDAEFNTDNAQSVTGVSLDASWLIQFVTDGQTYTVSARSLEYYFASVAENRFFYDGDEVIYDSKTGIVVNDFVNVLKTNSQPDAAVPLLSDFKLDIIGQPQQSDGFVDDFSVVVSYADSDLDGIADNPDFFADIVDPAENPNSKRIFLQRIIDFDNLERLQLVEPSRVNFLFATTDEIALVAGEFPENQIFYTFRDGKFWQLTGVGNSRQLLPRNDFIARVGRQDLAFQYRHNAPNSRRIDPGNTNIIDIYVVSASYYAEYQRYITDSTNSVSEPVVPNIAQLSQEYAELENFKMISDNIVIESVKFKPLFGKKSEQGLRAVVKVVKQRNSVASNSEIKSRVVSAMNQYFTIDKWDFGQTFYFSELSAFLHERLGDIISSVVLVPTDLTKRFGDLYEVRAQPNEIFVNAAIVDDIEVVDALTPSSLRISAAS